MQIFFWRFALICFHKLLLQVVGEGENERYVMYPDLNSHVNQSADVPTTAESDAEDNYNINLERQLVEFTSNVMNQTR